MNSTQAKNNFWKARKKEHTNILMHRIDEQWSRLSVCAWIALPVWGPFVKPKIKCYLKPVTSHALIALAQRQNGNMMGISNRNSDKEQQTLPVALGIILQQLLHHVLYSYKPAWHSFVYQRSIWPVAERWWKGAKRKSHVIYKEHFKNAVLCMTALSP